MKRTILSLPILLTIVFLVQMGCCGHAPVKPKVLSDDLKAKLGTIGLVSSRYDPSIALRKPLDKSAASSSTAKSYADSWISLGGTSEGAVQNGWERLTTALPEGRRRRRRWRSGHRRTH